MLLLYYKPYCPYSIKSDKLITKLSLPCLKINIDNNNNIQLQLDKKYGHTTVPAVFFIKDDDDASLLKKANTEIPSESIFIGGNDAFTEFIKNIDKLKQDNIRKIYLKYIKNDYDISYKNFLIIANNYHKSN